MALNWIIAGGGTGGHVTPALALGETIAKEHGRVLFLGSDRGLEARLVPAAGFNFVGLSSRQVMGRSLIGRATGGLQILAATHGAYRALRTFKPDLVVSVGGYAAMPATLATRLLRVPLFVVEPNAIPGRVNRLSARFATRVFVGFEAAATRLQGSAKRVTCHGIPLREELVREFRGMEPRAKPSQPLRLLVFGGSQGAHQINEALIAAVPQLAALPLEIFHQTGEADRNRVEAAYAATKLAHHVVDFEPEMTQRYRWADLAICRAGALTVAELALAGLPALLVPYPFAADDHQEANASALEEAGAALVLRGLSASGEGASGLVEAIRDLLTAPQSLANMSAQALRLARPDAATAIVSQCTRDVESLA